jgi:trans-2,3-dihydro-3-hydroxyanthranilate isomerase
MKTRCSAQGGRGFVFRLLTAVAGTRYCEPSMNDAHRYLHLDVFTKAPLSGNQLAVFHEPPIWSDATMQAIAREMSFSETTFLYPPKLNESLAQMRIFTPGGELPMAGHPTIGTTFALAHLGRIAHGIESITLDLGVGPTRVDLDWDDTTKALRFAWMTQPSPEFGPVFENRDEVARCLGLDVADLAPNLPVQIVSCGVPFVYVPLTNAHAVDRAALERGAWQKVCGSNSAPEHKMFVFAVEDTAVSRVRLYSRMFAPIIGIAEDPGTGGASGPLGSYLVHHGVVSGDVCDFVSHQGAKMQRACEISIRITSEGGKIARVQIGGTAIVVGSANLVV